MRFRQVHPILSRLTTGTAALALVATSALAGVTALASPAVAAADPKAGEACTSADLGKRYPFTKSVKVEPTITHFKGYFVTAGSTGSQAVKLSTQTQVTVAVGTSTTIKTNFDFGVLFKAEASINRTVQKTTATTSAAEQTITWNFTQPGYYGLYQGTRKVTGEYGSLNCDRVQRDDGTYATQWTERPGGQYTTFSTIEEGAIRCEDQVPASSIMKKAQEILGCDGTAAKKQDKKAPAPRAARKHQKASVNSELGTSAAPPGFTCLPGTYRIGTPDRKLYWTTFGAGDYFRLRPGPRLPEGATWSVCEGPQSNGRTEYALVNGYKGRCATMTDHSDTEGAMFRMDPCRTADDYQRFYIYRDVPGSDLVGLQLKANGHMVGQERVVDDTAMRQYSAGNTDGTGTYVLQKI
ncbi:hypothetical protein AB0I84_22675 [Streptomyces spectabilis]|uniref:hypothetical protein n=1 Tax=Streptomyces spectabilis TaxID=68270 RepID=UPI0033E5EDB4